MSSDSIKPDLGQATAPQVSAEIIPAAPTPPSDTTRFWGTILTVFMAALLYTIPAIVTIILIQSILAGNGDSAQGITDYFDTTTGQFVFMLVNAAISLVVLVVLMRITSETWKSIALTWPKAKAYAQLGKAILVYYSLLLLAGILIQEFTSIDTNQEQDIGFDKVSDGQLVFVFISLVILPPIIEELIFRGFLYTRFRKYFSVYGSAVIISILFSIAHLQLGNGDAPLWTAAIDTFILSMILVWLREKTGSIIPGMGLHAIKNAFAFTVLFLLS